MPRYLVERTFSSGAGLQGEAAIDANARQGVTWLHSFVTPARQRSHCILDGPSPEAIRMAACAVGLSIDRITEVRLVDPQGVD